MAEQENQGKPCGAYEMLREGEEIVLRIECESCDFFPSIEDDPHVMSMVIDILSEVGHVTKIVLAQKRDFEYPLEQVTLLEDVAKLYKYFVQQKLHLKMHLDPANRSKYAELQDIIYRLLKSDPVGAYVEISRVIRRDQIDIQQHNPGVLAANHPVLAFAYEVKSRIEQTQLIAKLKSELSGYKIGDRQIYRRYFAPIVRPDFMYTKVISSYPLDARELDSYAVGETDITILSREGDVRFLYHMVPPEFKLTEEKYELLDAARKILAEHKPKKNEFTDPARMRDVFFNVGCDLLEELAEYRGIQLRVKDKEELADILVRYTVGFGLIEVLLSDEKIQDISINSPVGRTPIFLVHAEWGDCVTNIIPTMPEVESWASKLRFLSGRPLDEANPVLDTELVLQNARARVAAITAPLNPSGIAYSFRRHRDKPWTLTLLASKWANHTINPLGAAVISFLADGARTMLVAGTRSSGKTSFLGAMLVELMRRVRIITIEDTLELPVHALKDLGYNIQSMKVASALTRGTTEVSADEGLRTTLRLGDSALFVGEVRSTEAAALYEAMRVGALANVVAGTIHGDSPYGVYDRVVNDLKVPRTSFKATDIIIVANQIRSPDGLRRIKRCLSITEIRKHWTDDPVREGGFVDLMKYDATTDSLQPTDALINGDSEILKSIAGNVREWAGNWDAVWENILLRARIKEYMIKTAEAANNQDIVEAPMVIAANDQFHKVMEQVKNDVGRMDPERIFFEWQEWFKKAVREMGNP